MDIEAGKISGTGSPGGEWNMNIDEPQPIAEPEQGAADANASAENGFYDIDKTGDSSEIDPQGSVAEPNPDDAIAAADPKQEQAIGGDDGSIDPGDF